MWSFLKTSRNIASYLSSFPCFNRCRYILLVETYGTVDGFFNASSSLFFSTIGSSFICGIAGSAKLLSSSFFPHLKIMLLHCSIGFTSVLLDSVPCGLEFWAKASWLICISKFWIWTHYCRRVERVSTKNYVVFLAIFAINSSKSSLGSFCCACSIRTVAGCFFQDKFGWLRQLRLYVLPYCAFPNKFGLFEYLYHRRITNLTCFARMSSRHHCLDAIEFSPSSAHWSYLVSMTTCSVKALMGSLSWFSACLLKIVLSDPPPSLLFAIC